MSVPTFGEMRERMIPVWQDDDQRDILWAGIYGSVARNRAHEESDVDVCIVLKEHCGSGEPVDLEESLAEACGREVSLLCICQGSDWAWGNVRLEALLSSRTVYGNRRDVEHLRREAMTFLNDGLTRLDSISEAVEEIKKQVAQAQTYENFIRPEQEQIRRKCIQALGKISELLDIQPSHHPIRTLLISLAFDHADEIHDLFSHEDLDVTTWAAPVWREIWGRLQPTSMTMWSFDAGCAVGGRSYIRHMLASKRLADTFEEGGVVDDSMYKDILR